MTNTTKINKEKALLILQQVLDMYQQFADAVQKKIIDPFSKGDMEECNNNLSKLGKNLTVSEVMKLVIRGASLLVPLMLKMSPENSEKQYLDEKEIAERTAYYQDRINKIMQDGI